MIPLSLQELFLRSGGKSVRVGDHQVIQMDRIPIRAGRVVIQFLDPPTGVHGVAIKAKGGGIELSDGRWVELVHLWDEPGFPRRIEHNVDCPEGWLRLWNIYRTKHKTGEVTEDAWTGNAGMIVDYADAGVRRYRCSAGPDEFNPDNFKFGVSWQTRD
ncbi:MAG TPA: hypothetical protein PLP42_06460 [Acidobacteriota bacterium]|nr:hypothetical protein [Acidobacteriota bacterium]